MCQECNGNYSNCPVCGVDDMREIDCPTCHGEKKFVSNCCGARIYDDIFICTECRDHCEEEEEVCETCKGEGVIYEQI